MSSERTVCAEKLSRKVHGIRDILSVCSSPTWWLVGRLSGVVHVSVKDSSVLVLSRNPRGGRDLPSCFASSVFCGHQAGVSWWAGIRSVGRKDGQGRWKAPSILPSLISAATAIFSYCLPTLPTMNIKWTYHTSFCQGGRDGKSGYGAMLSVRLGLS